MIVDEIKKQLYSEDRKKECFYVTDLGTCLRKMVLDFIGAEKKPWTAQELYMFKKSKDQQDKFAEMLRGTDNYFLLKEELVINDGLPDGWHGRLDFLVYDLNDKHFKPIEYKSSRSFGNPEHLPRPENVLQTKAYIAATRFMYLEFNIKKGILFYDDRSGSNLPLEFGIDNLDGLDDEMALCEKAYLGYTEHDIMPDFLPREIKLRNYGKIFYLEPNYMCDGYCKYSGVSCKPDLSKTKLADVKDGILVIRKGYEEYESAMLEMMKPKDFKDIDTDSFGEFCKLASDGS